MAYFDHDPDFLERLERWDRHARFGPFVVISLPLYAEGLWALWRGELNAPSLLAHGAVLGGFFFTLRLLWCRDVSPQVLLGWGLLDLVVGAGLLMALGLDWMTGTLLLTVYLWCLLSVGTVAFWLGLSTW